jgi:hypothetical protein
MQALGLHRDGGDQKSNENQQLKMIFSYKPISVGISQSNPCPITIL